MRIVAEYPFNNGKQVVEEKYGPLLAEIREIVASVSAAELKTKISEEKTMMGETLFNPGELNKAFKQGFKSEGWKPHKVYCDYPDQYYVGGYAPVKTRGPKPYREMDFVKEKLGVEVQFGKYAFMVYNICAKMTIFRNLGVIDCGIEIVPMHGFSQEMSTGVSYFEQFARDLDQRGVGNIDVPVLVLGVDADVLIKPEQEIPVGGGPGEVLELRR